MTIYDDYSQLKGDERKAFNAERVARRSDPLPTGTWYVSSRLSRKPRWWAATRLVVLGPGQVALWDGIVEQRTIAVQRVRRGWLRRSRITLVGADGSKTKVKAIPVGYLGSADVGLPAEGAGSFMGGAFSVLGDDPISAVIGTVLFIIWLLCLPFVFYFAARRAAAARRIVKQIGKVPPR